MHCVDSRLLSASVQTLFIVYLLPMLPKKKKKENKVLLPTDI
jgi:hypothetical protein